MKRLFLNKALSKQLKKKGFDEPCIAITNGKTLFYGKFHNQHSYYDCGLILYQQAIDWLDLRGIALMHYFNTNIMKWQYIIVEKQTKAMSDNFYDVNKAIIEALKLIK